MHTLPARTERLTFRSWREDDLPLAQALFGDARVTALVGGPFDDDAVRARLASELAMERELGVQYWPIALHDGAPAGCCGLKPRPQPRTLELGFYVLHSHWGRGYALEAARSVVAHAFDTLRVDALFAGHHPENLGSRRVVTSLGFAYTHDELYPPTGLQHPGYLLRRPY